ncbi:MAG TPA: hypothetical protein VH833_05905 [Gemmatimonadales bacterium]|jgi:hypothetical protein
MKRTGLPTAWILAVLAHVAAFGIALVIQIEFKRVPNLNFVQLSPEPELPPFAGVQAGRGPETRPQLGKPRGRAVVLTEPPDTLPSAAPTPSPPPAAARVRLGFIVPPSAGDGRLWVSPRPALPGDIAAALYEDRAPRDSMVVRRLRAMVDSLNVIIDAEQRDNRPPSWTVRGEDGKPTWGLDASGLYVAGIKIPTVALALLGSLLPPGNYDEAVRQRHLADMRSDLMQAAARAQNLEQFRRYVRELRARKQAQREAERQQRGDTVQVQP